MRTGNKKKSAKTGLPVLTFKPAKKTKKSDYDCFHLYINGKTDNIIYELMDGVYVGNGHEGTMAKALLEIPCRCFPRKTVGFIDLEKKILTGIFEDDCRIMLYNEMNKLSLSISLDAFWNHKGSFVDPDEDRLLTDLANELKKSANGLIETENELELHVSIKCIPDKTIKEMLEMLVTIINKAINQCKVRWMKEAKRLIKELGKAA